MSEPDADRDPIDKMADSFLARLRRGERPSVDEYAGKHPDMAAEIRERLSALVGIEQGESIAGTATGPIGGPARAPTNLSGAAGQLGDYLILREVGRGGMGVVYEAVQQSLGRHVALKILPWQSLGSASQVERFRVEARSAARLHHSNIVPVFGVGEHGGTHYYAMQFIQGQGLDAVFDELRRLRGVTSGGPDPPRPAADDGDATAALTAAHGLVSGRFESGPAEGAADRALDKTEVDGGEGAGPSRRFEPTIADPNSPLPLHGDGLSGSVLTDRSELTNVSEWKYYRGVARVGLQVAEALAYAHGQGILHRDIKPSNLMMDARGTVWVTDFGLAKAEGSDGPTQTGDIVGTLRYMAPERFDGWSDPRSDVYALGATLYELLTLRPLFEGANRARLIDSVLHETPAPPRKLDRRIPLDLETIVLKALAKEPAARYATAAQMADDLRRFIADQPVHARRVGTAERAWRWSRRNPVVAGMASALLAVFVVGFIAVAVQWRRAERLRERSEGLYYESEGRRFAAERLRGLAETRRVETEEQRAIAEANFGRARRAVDEYFTKVSESRLLSVPGLQPLRKDLLMSALTFYDDFLKNRAGDPTLRSALAAVHLKAATIHDELGQAAEARKDYHSALALYDALSRAEPRDIEARNGMAECCLGLGLGDPDRAKHLLFQSIAIREEVVASRPSEERLRVDLARSYRALANAEIDGRRVNEALGWFLKARDIGATLVRDHPEDPARQHDFAENLGQIAEALCKLGRHQDETTVRPLAIEHARSAYEHAPHVLEYGRHYGRLCWRDGNNLFAQNRLDEGSRDYRRSIEIYQKLARDNPAVPDLQLNLADVYETFSRDLRNHARASEAPPLLREALAAIEALPKGGPKELLALARVLAMSAGATDGSSPAAEEQARRRRDADRAVDAVKRAIAAGHRDVAVLRGASALETLRLRDDFQALVDDLERSTRAEAAPGAVDGAARPASSAAPTGVAAERPDGGAARYRADLAASQHAIGLIQLALGDRDEALKSLKQVVELREAAFNRDPKNLGHREDLGEARIALGLAEWRSGRCEDAARSWREGLEIGERALREDPREGRLARRFELACREVGFEYAAAGLWDEAAAVFSRMFELAPPGDFFLWMRQASLLWAIGDEPGYLEHCRRMAARFDSSVGPSILEGMAHALTLSPRSAVDPSKTLDIAERALKALPKNGWALYALAFAQYRAGRYGAAAERLDEAVQADPAWAAENGAQWLLLAMARHQLGDADSARRHLERAESFHEKTARSLLDTPVGAEPPNHRWWVWADLQSLRLEAFSLIEGTPPPDDPWLRLRRWRSLTSLGRKEKADVEIKAALALRSDDPAVKAAHERVLAELVRVDRKEPGAGRDIVPRRSDPRFWIGRGLVHDALGQADEAGSDFDRAIALKPADPGDWLAILRLESKHGQADRLKSTMDSFQAFYKAKTGVRQVRALPAEFEGKIKSEPGPSVSLRFFNFTPRAVRYYWIDFGGGRTLYGSVPAWGEVAQITGAKHPWLLADQDGKGLAIFLPGPGDGFAILTDAIRDGGVEPPDDPEYLPWLGEVYAERGRNDRAEAAFDKAVAARPDDPIVRAARSRFLHALGRKDRAEADYAEAVKLAGTDPQLLRELGDGFARRARWPEAASILAKAVEAAPAEHWYWYQLAPLLLESGDIEAYRRHCLGMLDRFGATQDPMIAERLAKTSLLTAEPLDEAGRPALLARRSVELGEKSPWLNYFQVCEGIAEFRAGRFADALNWFRKSRRPNSFPSLDAMTDLFDAMARQRLGQADEARRSLDRARRVLDAKFPKAGVPKLDSEWHDWLMCLILRREAEALIGGEPAKEAGPPAKAP